MPPAQPPQQPSQPDAAAAAAALPPAVTLAQLTEAAQLPASLRDKFPRLAVIPPNTPAPASMLTKLWQVRGRGLAGPVDVGAQMPAAPGSAATPPPPQQQQHTSPCRCPAAADGRAGCQGVARSAGRQRASSTWAQLPDGRVWCLPQAQQLAAVSVACRDARARLPPRPARRLRRVHAAQHP